MMATVIKRLFDFLLGRWYVPLTDYHQLCALETTQYWRRVVAENESEAAKAAMRRLYEEKVKLNVEVLRLTEENGKIKTELNDALNGVLKELLASNQNTFLNDQLSHIAEGEGHQFAYAPAPKQTNI